MLNRADVRVTPWQRAQALHDLVRNGADPASALSLVVCGRNVSTRRVEAGIDSLQVPQRSR